MISREQTVLLALVRASLWTRGEIIPEVDWSVVEKCAQDQGVIWMAYLGAKTSASNIPSEQRKNWRSVLHSGVIYNDQLNAFQNELIEWLNERKIRSAILKGTSCSRYYTHPEARPLGDIDILIDKENMSAVGKYLEKQGYYPAQHDHSFHVGYYGKEAVVELHYAATEIPSSNGGKVVADEMKNFLDSTYTAVYGSLLFPVLSDEYQALMLLLHMERHMVMDGIGLRQLCDWAVFVNGSIETHWDKSTLELLKRCGLLFFAKVLTKTCVNYLGLDQNKAIWCLDVEDSLAQALIDDIFRGGNMGSADVEGMGSLFTERHSFGRTEQHTLTGLVAKLVNLSYGNFPWSKRHKIFVPFCCLYIPVRYLFRLISGQRTRKSITNAIEIANKRHRLYKALHLYEID